MNRLPQHKKAMCGGFPNPQKDKIRREFADEAFEILEKRDRARTRLYTVSCPGLRENEHEVIGYDNKKELVILAEHDPTICMHNPAVVPGDILDVVASTQGAGYPKISVIDMDVFRTACTKEEAQRITKTLKSANVTKHFCIRTTAPIARLASNTPMASLEKMIRKNFKVIAYRERSYKGGCDQQGMPMKIFQWVCYK